MAKPRKPKNEDASKPESSAPVVRHQKLCLSIDLDKRRVYGFVSAPFCVFSEFSDSENGGFLEWFIGSRRIAWEFRYTELEIAVPEIGIVGLHAENLGIDNVYVDGEPAEFEYYPYTCQVMESESRWSYVTSPNTAADAAGSVYISALERELVPNLLINCFKPFKTGGEQQDQVMLENGVQQPSGEIKQNVRLVRVNYWVEKAETGIHFDGNVLHTDNQIRRARCWFPCIDDTSQRCCYDLEFTVAQNLAAVSSGSLLYQVLSKDDPPRKTYVYKLDVAVSAQWISLAVGPFEVLPDHQFSLISHMCLPVHISKLWNTVEFFHNAFSCYKDYLSVNFPFGSYKQVFIEPEMAVCSLSLGASMSIFSSQILFDDKIIDQTIDTRIKLAYALAQQWFGVYITPETPNDEWLLDGLAGFMTDLFIKKHLGNNEARYRRYKANCAVCKADDSGATSLSSSASSKDLYGTQSIGLYKKIRSWKSVAILQMLEKQMGPESFRKILQTIVSRAEDKTRSLRSLSTKEFRHFANKVGNLERPFLKEFFPRWVESCGSPVLRMGFSYNKRKNMVELAVLRGCTAVPDASASVVNSRPESENRDSEVGWPGMMSIRVHELDGTFDHPVLPMAGETWQLVEIQCHSKLAARRFQKPKKGAKPDGSDDNGDGTPALDIRSSMESPLLWMRADPEMEYLADIHFSQPIQMWFSTGERQVLEESRIMVEKCMLRFVHKVVIVLINQLEKDKDVIAQAQAIAMLEASPQLSFNIVTALNNFLTDSKVFWRVRIEAAFALANTASEETDWAGLLHLVKFYRGRRFDADIGLPKPNDFHDFAEYFVLEAIPHAVAMVRAADRKSPREAVEFVLQLLKYNDNNGNPYSDVFWLAALIQSVGELEFGQQSILFLSSLLKRIDRLLQFDRLMPSYNGILTISCIRTLTQIALKLSGFIPLDRVFDLLKPFRDAKAIWQVRIEASRALLDLEFHCRGIDAALSLFMKYLEEEPSSRGQVKLGVHTMRLCQIRGGSNSTDIKSQTLVNLLHLLEGRMAFNNVFLRHYLFCILQILGGRPPTLFGVPRDHRPLHLGDVEAWHEQKNIFPNYLPDIKLPSDAQNLSHNNFVMPEGARDMFAVPEASNNGLAVLQVPVDGLPVPQASNNGLAVLKDPVDGLPVPEASTDGLAILKDPVDGLAVPEASIDGLAVPEASIDGLAVPEASKDGLAVSEASKDGLLASEASKDGLAAPESSKDILAAPDSSKDVLAAPESSKEGVAAPEAFKAGSAASEASKDGLPAPAVSKDGLAVSEASKDGLPIPELSKEADTISTSHGRKMPVVKIRMKRSTATSRATEVDTRTVERSQGGLYENDHGASSSVSVDAPHRNFAEAVSISNQNLEEVNSCHDLGSQMTASIGSAKLASDGDDMGKELQCTADSSKVFALAQPDDPSSSSFIQDNSVDAGAQKFASLQALSDSRHGHDKEKEKKRKDRDKKRKREDHKGHRDDPEYLERKRLKKEKKKKEKEMAKLLNEAKTSSLNDQGKVSSVELTNKKQELKIKSSAMEVKPIIPSGSKLLIPGVEARPQATTEGNSVAPKFRIKIKNRTLNKS
ncbi:Coatomer beta subunit [Trema orientale]|uniref:Transcription initiation factor TFIID subunit 2 n=1 Tax=Trema orientale TaxID=63057 RepID=A0A2P5EM06_TREOI|nr:Coatomer beta subunit [Trema orientale]